MKQERELYAKGHLVFTFIRGLHTVIEEDIKIRLKKDHGLLYPAFKILWILSFEDKMNMSEISEITLTNISNTYRQLVKLKDMDLVTIGSNEDARIREIRLTDKGERLVQTILRDHSNRTDLNLLPFLSNIPKEDLDIFIEVLTDLSRSLLGDKYTSWALNTSEYLKES
ncbi:MarR family winged helix-turn-helix transcriptional regulator [Cytobacillus sp. FJAT-54145]|uniref:MarR family winged helix-turn-helix transcriptional regulator n=1 Tax=Cytobacillus spartinae TaxID=3299023 RepID=A0ABW6K879_9BACI